MGLASAGDVMSVRSDPCLLEAKSSAGGAKATTGEGTSADAGERVAGGAVGARADHGSAVSHTTANAVATITCEANAGQPAPMIPRCGISSHAPPMVMAAPVTVTAATAASRRCTRRIATATLISASGKVDNKQQDEQGAVVGVVGDRTDRAPSRPAGR